jgi:hypothetical protein
MPGSIHHVHFNRGAAASQEYTRRFGDKSPGKVGPAAFDWLSRGAAEAIQEFIARAEGPGWGLRVGAYEFTDDHVLTALKEASSKRKADVSILYHARNDTQKKENEKQIKKFALGKICEKRNATGLSLSHNKVIVLIKGSAAQDGTEQVRHRCHAAPMGLRPLAGRASVRFERRRPLLAHQVHAG